jgi:hypothetical protein
MNPRLRSGLLIWAALLLAASLEFSASFLAMPTGVRPILVALGFMRLLTAPDIAQSFAIGGIFWLIVLLGLAMMDPMTRAVYAVIG